jgi:hypothetical protein
MVDAVSLILIRVQGIATLWIPDSVILLRAKNRRKWYNLSGHGSPPQIPMNTTRGLTT